jgi:hypothetical protein
VDAVLDGNLDRFIEAELRRRATGAVAAATGSDEPGPG